jgi:Fur family peroxide stress response transcriptional regulator
MAEKKFSRQREAIVQVLRARKDHPTADDVYMALKDDYPRLSLGTVYRNLALLSEEGCIMRIRSYDGPDRYDGNAEIHYHFVCKDCKRVLDIDIPVDFKLDKEAEMATGHEVDGHDVLFFGRCSDCITKQ